jgi:peptidoglycan/xylan/chitin deacetylase (PgdA/CDA1 family)
MLKDFARKCLYASGALGVYHRLRNRDSLTVAMFHRTLRPDDPRWATCDPDYTLSEATFERSLAFFARHYRVVSLDEVLDAHRGGAPLPPHALLISFDDGWADNHDYALPALRRAGLPGVIFVAADAVDAAQPFFQERLIGALRRGALDLPALAQSVAAHGGNHDGAASADAGLPGLRRLIAALERMPSAARRAALAPFADAMDDGLRQMVDVAELHRLREGGVALGLHGKTHTAMTRADDLDAELGGARAALLAHLGDDDAGDACRTMSFPHGAYDQAIAARAREAGYTLLFTSVPVLNDARGGPTWLLGRTGFETDTVVDARDRFRDDWLAWYLFRRPVRRLA